MSATDRGRRTLACTATALAGLAGWGCGSSPPTPLDATSARALHAAIAQVRAAAGAGDRAAAVRALSALARRVAGDEASGELSRRHAAALRTGIARARGRVTAEIAAPAPALTPPAAPVAQPPKGRGRGKGKGKQGKGH